MSKYSVVVVLPEMQLFLKKKLGAIIKCSDRNDPGEGGQEGGGGVGGGWGGGGQGGEDGER